MNDAGDTPDAAESNHSAANFQIFAISYRFTAIATCKYKELADIGRMFDVKEDLPLCSDQKGPQRVQRDSALSRTRSPSTGKLVLQRWDLTL